MAYKGFWTRRIGEMFRVLRKNEILSLCTKSINDFWANPKNRISDYTYLVKKKVWLCIATIEKINNLFGMFDPYKVYILFNI